MVSEHDWTWLKMAQRNLRSRAKPENDKPARLQPADKLEDLGFSLMAEAETGAYWNDHSDGGMTLLQRALAFRDGLMIALLIRRPFRIKNFVSLEIGKSLVIEDDAASFAFLASEVKGKRPIDVAFPKSLMSALERDLDYYRPILLSESGKAKGLVTNALWIRMTARCWSRFPCTTRSAGARVKPSVRRYRRTGFATRRSRSLSATSPPRRGYPAPSSVTPPRRSPIAITIRR
jgi:hypothetical protein